MQMNTSKRTRIAIAVLAAAAIAPAAPAAANESAPFAEAARATNQGPAADKKDGSEAVVLRRDGDRATQFVADVSPAAVTAGSGSGDAFDWGDAAIGAGASLLVVALVASSAGAVGGRRRRTPTTAGAASQEA
jgi:hypothetical protein